MYAQDLGSQEAWSVISTKIFGAEVWKVNTAEREFESSHQSCTDMCGWKILRGSGCLHYEDIYSEKETVIAKCGYIVSVSAGPRWCFIILLLVIVEVLHQKCFSLFAPV